MRHFLTIIFILTCLWTKSQAQQGWSSAGGSAKITQTAKLGIPFGTIAKLKAEIYDGERLRMKAYWGVYLLKINSVNDKPIKGTLLLRFTDETGTLANEDFGLYKLLYKKDDDSPEPELTEEQVHKMKEKYVGKKLTLMAYETGQFLGIPANYFKYRPIKVALGFHFEQSLVVVSNLTK